ncbi:MAG: ribosome rescue protein RqcH [Candidatus Hodarchaeales archaeon]|jgi:predicted ribosome quality control (RQC) complex YloA/Tae2 family protein
MSSLGINAITNELQDLIGYRIENIYRDLSDSFYLFKLKGKGLYKNPFLLIEPGIRIHLTEIKHPVPERPSDKIMALRSHLKGTELIGIRQIDFDRLVEINLKGKQQYRVFIELFGNRPNFVVVGNQNRVISALWYRKMRHRDLLPGKEFEFPPSQGKSLIDMTIEEINHLIATNEVQNEKIVQTLAKNAGGLIAEEVLMRSNVPKNILNTDLNEIAIASIFQALQAIRCELKELKPSVELDSNGTPISFQPINLKSVSDNLQYFDNFSLALDFYYSRVKRQKSISLKEHDKKKKRLLKILEAQKSAVAKFKRKKKRYKEIGDIIYLHLDEIDELLTTVVDARKKNIEWSEIQAKLAQAKNQGMKPASIFEEIYPERGEIRLCLDSELIETDFRKSATEIANDYYLRAKKASRKITPANEAIIETERKISALTENIVEQKVLESVQLKRRKRKWYEKYHWTHTLNKFLIIGGKNISGNEEIVKRRMKENDLFFHAELHGAPYTILIRESSDHQITEDDLSSAAQLAAVFSSGWKAGYGAIDVYYVLGNQASFTAPSGEYIPKGGIIIRGSRTYIRGVELVLAIGVQIGEYNSTVIFGSEKDVRSLSPILVVIKPGSISKGKLAKNIHRIFIEKTKSPEDQAKIRNINLNEFVQAIPHESMIVRVEFQNKN